MGDLGYEEFKEKLELLPTAALKAVAARAALQELPYAFELSDQIWNNIDGQQFLLACLRASIVSGLAATRPTPEILALNADVIANLKAPSVSGRVTDVPKGAFSTFNAALCTTNDTSDMIQELIFNLTTYYWDGFRERDTDASALTIAPEDTEQVFASKLWYGEAPEHYASLSQQFFDKAAGTPWEFWAEWYEGMLNGEPLDWELQRGIALINNDIWMESPEAVAKEIEKARARWQVQFTLTGLKDSFKVQSSARHGIGGNNPPEYIEDERLSGPITLIWEAAEELSTALEEKSPARESIEAILDKLKSGLASFLRWCASKGDIAVDTLIKWGIPATGAGYAANYPEKIEALIEALERWLPFLS